MDGHLAPETVVAAVKLETGVTQLQQRVEAEVVPVRHGKVENATNNVVRNIAHGRHGQAGLIAQFPAEEEVSSVLAATR